MKTYFFKTLSKTIPSVIFLISPIYSTGGFVKAEYSFEEFQIESSTKSEEDSSVIPNNPFEIVEMIRRYNSLNDATQPSDAIEDALNSFNNFEQK